MPKALVIGALLPTGGGYMAYHVGRLLARHYGYELHDVQMVPPERRLFTYDTPIKTIEKDALETIIQPDDLLILSPAFSEYLYGLRLPCRKIMYVQGFRKLLVMDCQCDLYVSVSRMVQRHIRTLYDMRSPVIPAFIHINQMPQPAPWHERPTGSVLVYANDNSPDHQNLYRYVLEQMQQRMPHIDMRNVLDGRGMNHEEFLRALGSVRYVVNLTLAEGFGLVPLEAMAMGSCVTGLDGLGGREYMRPGENCLTESMTSLPQLVYTLCIALENEQLAYHCAQNGMKTAKQYGHAKFKTAWLRELSQFLGQEPMDA